MEANQFVCFFFHFSFLSFFFKLTSFYLFNVGAEGYCYNWSLWHTNTHSVGLLLTRDRSVAETYDNTQHPWQTGIHAPRGIQTRNSGKRAAVDPRLRTLRNRKLDIVIFSLRLLYTFSTRWHNTMNSALSRSTLKICSCNGTKQDSICVGCRSACKSLNHLMMICHAYMKKWHSEI